MGQKTVCCYGEYCSSHVIITSLLFPPSSVFTLRELIIRPLDNGLALRCIHTVIVFLAPIKALMHLNLTTVVTPLSFFLALSDTHTHMRRLLLTGRGGRHQ